MRLTTERLRILGLDPTLLSTRAERTLMIEAARLQVLLDEIEDETGGVVQISHTSRGRVITDGTPPWFATLWQIGQPAEVTASDTRLGAVEKLRKKLPKQGA
jgi:hypothetical protein